MDEFASNSDKKREHLRQRQIAYLQVFHEDNEFLKVVMGDLGEFCRADVSTFHPDARAHALQEGRREVYLRIKEYLDLTPEELFIRRN